MPGRNDPCPCGSGKKYKKCCLERDEAASVERRVIPFAPPPASERSAGPAGDLSDPEEELDLEEVVEAIDDEMLEFAEAMGDCDEEDEDRIIEDRVELMDLLERGSQTGDMVPQDKADELVFALHPELVSWEAEDYERAELDDGVNWHLHRILDALVIRRATDPSLPDGDAIRRLKKNGRRTAEAIHEVATLLTEDIWERMRSPEQQGESGEAGGLPGSTRANLEALTQRTNEKISKLGR